MSILNALTIDVEEWFHVSLFRRKIRREEWDSLKSTVVANTCLVLRILAEKNVQATFFVLGWVAERYPEIVIAIQEHGHEIGSHTYSHQIIYEQSRQEFAADVRRSIAVLEDLTQEKVNSFRAPSYSITRSSLWAWEALADLGLTCDSSIFPVKHDLYGIPDAPRFPFYINLKNYPRLVEVPLSTIQLRGKNIPMAGGGYLRLYPYWFIRHSIRRINREGRPAIIYLHPWELDPDLPRLKIGFFKELRHYGNLSLMEEKLRRLLGEFSFGPLRQVLNATPIQNDWPVTTPLNGNGLPGQGILLPQS
jgi:polysaccharide deacetylase family protein (PEP-CTERM system associated)